MKYIGFTTKYYTLWEVSSDHKYTYYKYIKNISMDFEKAQAKEPTAIVDLTLRGHSSFRVERVSPDCFQFGKYKEIPYTECNDYPYMAWYHNKVDIKDAKARTRKILLAHGYMLWNGETMVTAEQYKRNEYLKANIPKFSAKVEANMPFKFKCDKNVRKAYDATWDIECGVMDIPFCHIVFPNITEMEWKEVKYYLPTIHEFSMDGVKIKNTTVVIDKYNATRVDDLTYRIEVISFHTEY